MSQASTATTASPPPDVQPSQVDPMLVQQTKLQIRSLVNEVAQLAQSDCSLEEFYDGFLNRVTSALACVGGAIWSVDDNGRCELRYQINLAKARLDNEEKQIQHSGLLQRVIESGQSTLVQPDSGSVDEDGAGNPTGFLLVLGVIKLDEQVQGVVEIFQRPGGGPTTQRGYLRFVLQMCDLASDYLKNRRLRHFSDRQELWDNLEGFIHTIHRGLDVRTTVYAIANEARRLIGADRVSVALRHGRKYKVETVSGLDTVERRSREVRQLSSLATAVLRGGTALWYHGETEDLPPQIEKKLNQYVDQSHARLVAVIPLRKPARDSNRRRPEKPFAALIVEQLQDCRLTDSIEKRIEVVAEHSADALSNALEYNSLFLLPLWRALGKARLVLAARNLPKTALALAVVVGLVAGLCVTPADFDMAATGTLRPTVRRDIFAGVDGKLIEVPVDAGQTVKRTQTLARLENNPLASEIIDLRGSIAQRQKEINAINRIFTDNPQMTPVEEIQLSGKLAQLEEAIGSYRRQLEVYTQQQHLLIITSPIDGQVGSWKVRDKLLDRPVQLGQRLMTVFDPAGPWELELSMPERRMRHVDRAAAGSDGPLEVTFILATHPGDQFTGYIVHVDRTAEVRDDNGNTVRIRVTIPTSENLPDLRDGAKVTARVKCGRQSIGYVWFHELIDTVQAKVLFWF